MKPSLEWTGSARLPYYSVEFSRLACSTALPWGLRLNRPLRGASLGRGTGRLYEGGGTIGARPSRCKGAEKFELVGFDPSLSIAGATEALRPSRIPEPPRRFSSVIPSHPRNTNFFDPLQTGSDPCGGP